MHKNIRPVRPLRALKNTVPVAATPLAKNTAAP